MYVNKMCEESLEPLLVFSLRAHRGEISCIDISGSMLATGGGDGALKLWRWRPRTGWADAEVAAKAHRYGITALSWAASGALLASAGVDGVARVWSRALVTRRTLAAPGATAARALCWVASRLLVGHDDGALYVWSVKSGVMMTRLVPCDGALHALTTLARGALLLVACTSGTVKIFNLDEISNSDKSVGVLPPTVLWEDGAHDLGALCAASSVEGNVAASGGHDGRVRLWNLFRTKGSEGRCGVVAGDVLCGHTAAVTSLRWARGAAGELLASASLDRTARLWAPLTSTCLRVLHAHSRYLTCIALAKDLRFMLTGSNDRSVRTWSIGKFTLEDEIETPCSVLSHFGLGDLMGIEPIYDDFYVEDVISRKDDDKDESDRGAECVWYCKAGQGGAINSIATYKELLVTACSDGSVHVFRWCEQLLMMSCERVIAAHRYPAMTVDIGAGGVLLLSAGLDGRARLWDLQSGCELLSLAGESVSGGEAGGGGVRCARISPHRPPLLMLVTDDGAIAVWSVSQSSSEPLHVYEPFAEAATCCAWTSDGQLCAAAGVGAEIRLLSPPPNASTLHVQSAVHDLGVLDCDFAPNGNQGESYSYKLATAGRDALVKIWSLRLENDSSGGAIVTMCLLWVGDAHGSAVETVRWRLEAENTLYFVTSGADGWARAWSLEGSQARVIAAVKTGEGLSATAASFLSSQFVATGNLTGNLELWRLPLSNELCSDEESEAVEPRHWQTTGVLRWLREYVTKKPGTPVSAKYEADMMHRVIKYELNGPHLLDEPVEKILEMLLPSSAPVSELLSESDMKKEDECTGQNNLGVDLEETASVCETYIFEEVELRSRLEDELRWLRRDPPSFELENGASHSLRCPLTHELLREPARASDGFSYERANILDYFFGKAAMMQCADGAVSPLSGRRLSSPLVAPNLGLRQRLREYLATGLPSPCP